MKKNIKFSHPIIITINNIIIDLPTPTSISYMWNWGSLLGVVFAIQIVTGIFLASHFISEINLAFSSVIHISRDVRRGWFMRITHINGASIFFIIIFIHISRGLIFSSYKLNHVWLRGVVILLILMGTAFLGYVLPWGQISFWGATVITNLLSAVPYVGTILVEWLWGGFRINQATLSRFFTLHFLMPFILVFIVITHLASLHITGSNNPIGLNSNWDKITFHPFFSTKDLIGILVIITILLYVSLIAPLMLGDPENFNIANPLNTPIHIQPEWYFLFAYAILRSIPNKLGGVISLVLSILIISQLTLSKVSLKRKKFSPNLKLFFWTFSRVFLILTWIGANPVEQPFEIIGKIFSLIYFFLIIFLCFFKNCFENNK